MAEALIGALKEEILQGAAGRLFLRSCPSGTIRGVVMIVPEKVIADIQGWINAHLTH